MKSETPKWRFLRLGALTIVSGIATHESFKALGSIEYIPPVDALHEPTPDGGRWPSISVIVPARNEERNLPRLLSTLLFQRYSDYEVIVIDDQSSDDTPNILKDWVARDKRLRVVQGKELPRSEGWLGKPYAMHQGVKQARGEWLLFTDADTAHSPLSISSSIAYAMAHKVDLLSLLPHFELCTPAERVVMPVAFMGIMNLYPPHRVNDPRSKIAIANGQYMLIRREVYDAVGGIARVKEKIAEDLEFAQVVKSADYYLYIAEGMHLVSVRMYTNFGEIWEGWGKLSFKGRPVLALMTVSGVFFLTLMPVLMGIWASQAWRSSAQDETLHNRITAIWTSLLAGWCVLMPLTYRRRIDKTLGLGPGWTLTQPVGVIIMAAIMLSSFIRLLTGKGVIWKGRTYHGE